MSSPTVSNNFFDEFDELLQFHTSTIKIPTKKAPTTKAAVTNKILLFKDFLTVEGTFKKPLFDFISWLISDNDREIHLAKKCNLKFLHLQGKLSLLRVAIHLDSRCLVNSTSIEWVHKCLLSWKKHCVKYGSQADINHAEVMLGTLGPEVYHPNASFVLPPSVDITSMAAELKEMDLKTKYQTQVRKQLEVRNELADTNMQIADDIVRLNVQADGVEDRVIGRFLGLFAKIDEDLCFEMVRIEEDLDKVQRLHSIALNRDMDPSNSEQVDKAILECIATNYDHQLKLQKDIENMRGYNSGLVKSKNAEIDTLLKELADKNHYMASAITYNSALAVSKLAGDVTNKLFSHSIAVSSPTSKGHATRPLPKQQQRKIPYTTEESRQFF